MEYYEKIKELRVEKNITQEELAKLTGYNDRSSIAKIENGKVDISQSKLEIFAKVLGCTPAYLMGWNDFNNSIHIKNSYEKNLIDLYRTLNSQGQHKAMEYIKDLVSSNRYIKNTEERNNIQDVV